MMERTKTRKSTGRQPRGVTKRTILVTAERLFAEKGFHGTSVDEIVIESQVNKRMVYHYFGDKFGLYCNIFKNHWDQLKEKFTNFEEQQPASNATAPITNILGLYEIFLDYIGENPQFARLIAWDGLEGNRVALELWNDHRSPMHLKALKALNKAQQNGYLSKEVDTNHMIISIFGATLFYFISPIGFTSITGGIPLSKENISKRKIEMINFLRPHFRLIPESSN